jgi:hypothetical protein
MKTKFCSTIAPLIGRFVILKRSLGLNYIEQANILLSLDRFLTDTSNDFRDLTAEAFLEWCKSFMPQVQLLAWLTSNCTIIV